MINMNIINASKLLRCVAIIFIMLLLCQGCTLNKESSNDMRVSQSNSNDSEVQITKETAYNGVNNYCHTTYDWDIAKDNPSIMYVEMGEETEIEYQVIFKSYTGSLVYFYVNKQSGITRIVEYVPSLDIKEETGTINVFDYLK